MSSKRNNLAKQPQRPPVSANNRKVKKAFKKAEKALKKAAKRVGTPIADHDPTIQQSLLTENFENFITAPDIFGPFRLPRNSDTSKTGLWVARGRHDLEGDTTTTVRALRLANEPGKIATGITAYSYGASGESVAFGTATDRATNAQFPAFSQMLDWSINAACITVEYIGTTLECGGEVMLGSVPAATDSSTHFSDSSYGTLYFYPGVIAHPMRAIAKDRARTYLTKYSPVADRFFREDEGGSIGDINIPFVAVSGLPDGQKVRVTWTIVGEYRSKITPANVIPYEKSTESFSKDLDALQDSYANLSNRASTTTWSDKWLGPFMDAFGTQALTEGVGTGLSLLGLEGSSSSITSLLGNAMTMEGGFSLGSLMEVAMPAIAALI